jgi:predicted amidohydrolase YtcJ
VAPLNPLESLKAAVTRQTLDGRNPDGWVPEQKITLEEAIRAYTVGSAYAEFQEQVKGSLTAGKLADLVVLDRDIFQMGPAKLDQVKVALTIVDGKVVWEAQ